jgi:large subunit ribosomal protein L25
MVAGDSRYAADVVIPDGVKLISDPKMSVVHLSVKAAEEEVVVAAPVEGEAGAAPAAEGDAAATAAAPAAEADKKDDKKDKKK